MSTSSNERAAELRELFFESAQELLQALNDEALKLEKQPDDAETVHSIRRIVHTLKGDAAACGFRDLSETAHELEDALSLESATSGSSLAELSFTAADTFCAMLAAYRQHLQPPSAEPLRKMVRDLTAASAAPRSSKQDPEAEVPAALSEAEELAVANALAQGKRVYQVSARIDPLCAMPIAARQLLLNALRASGDLLSERSPAGPASSTRIDLLLASSQTAERVATACRIPTVIAEAKVRPLGKKARKAKAMAAPVSESAATTPVTENKAAPVAAGEAEDDGAKSQTSYSALENVLRVDAERIDNVLNLVGELIIGKSMLQQVMAELARRYPREALRNRFADAMGFQARVLNDLQRSVMKIRMVPVEQLFRRFPRVVRDVGRQCGKQVELTLSGQDTDLDKGLLDAISEPLTHLVRNAVSHGIEAPEERTRNGKPASGTIHLNAYHQGNQVIVEISDDGRGIDVQKIRAKAIQQRLVSAEEAAQMSEADVLRLVFRPGFSTAEQITEVSGRGVGLDVVQSVLQRLKGTVEIETHGGHGTTFRLRLPLTLAIIKALLFRVEKRLYAVPLNSVAEITRARESDLHQVDRYEVLQLRNQALSVVRLGRPPAVPAQNISAKIFVLVMALGDRKLGLIVDGLEGEEELVIKALDDQTVVTDLVSGASILGDGRVVLILNLAAIVERSFKAGSGELGQASFGLLLSQAERARVGLAATGGRS